MAAKRERDLSGLRPDVLYVGEDRMEGSVVTGLLRAEEQDKDAEEVYRCVEDNQRRIMREGGEAPEHDVRMNTTVWADTKRAQWVDGRPLSAFQENALLVLHAQKLAVELGLQKNPLYTPTRSPGGPAAAAAARSPAGASMWQPQF